MRIIELTDHLQGHRIYVNVDKIAYYDRPNRKIYTLVMLSSESVYVDVKETPEQITELIKNAPEL
jgi:hypothetical protein